MNTPYNPSQKERSTYLQVLNISRYRNEQEISANIVGTATKTWINSSSGTEGAPVSLEIYQTWSLCIFRDLPDLEPVYL